MTSVVNQVAYLKTTWDFPSDIRQLTVQLSKTYIDTANAIPYPPTYTASQAGDYSIAAYCQVQVEIPAANFAAGGYQYWRLYFKKNGIDVTTAQPSPYTQLNAVPA